LIAFRPGEAEQAPEAMLRLLPPLVWPRHDAPAERRRGLIGLA
jgi:hypothetical protein